jgi:hypothetical protein
MFWNYFLLFGPDFVFNAHSIRAHGFGEPGPGQWRKRIEEKGMTAAAIASRAWTIIPRLSQPLDVSRLWRDSTRPPLSNHWNGQLAVHAQRREVGFVPDPSPHHSMGTKSLLQETAQGLLHKMPLVRKVFNDNNKKLDGCDQSAKLSKGAGSTHQ